MKRPGRGLVIAAPASGAGKTMVTIGLQRAFAKRGVSVAGAKCGPDYIDPGFHAVATGRSSINLDGFAMSGAILGSLAAEAASKADLVIAEGVMGLFDGARTAGRSGASADIARHLGWPVLLVVDARAAAQTIAAVAHGCATFPGAPKVAGVIVNRIASPAHGRMVEEGLKRVELPLLGQIATDDRLATPSRHLGLIQADELEGLDAKIDRIADRLAAQCDLDAIHAAAGETLAQPPSTATITPPGQRIAIARDEAFGFLYPHLLNWWRRAGAEIMFFSPLGDEPPPMDCDTCWLPGGYPELHAGRIASNRRFMDGLRAFAADRPVHGECGGYMVLGRMIEDADGTRHAMTGLLPIETSFARRKLTLGYRAASIRGSVSFARPHQKLYGHEFHHATVTASEGEAFADVTTAEGLSLPPAGHRLGTVTGSFFHLIA